MVALGFLLAALTTQTATGNTQTVQVEEITIRLPGDWQIESDDKDPLIKLVADGPADGPAHTTQERLLVYVSPHSSRPLNIDASFTHIENSLTEISSGEFTASGHRILWRHSHPKSAGSRPVSVVDYYLSHDNREYHFRFFADQRLVSQLLPVFQSILMSIGPPDWREQTSPAHRLRVRRVWLAAISILCACVIVGSLALLARTVPTGRLKVFIWLAIPPATALAVIMGSWQLMFLSEVEIHPMAFPGFCMLIFPHTAFAFLHVARSVHRGHLRPISLRTAAEFRSVLFPLCLAYSSALYLVPTTIYVHVAHPSFAFFVAVVASFFAAPVVGFIGAYWVGRRMRRLMGS